MVAAKSFDDISARSRKPQASLLNPAQTFDNPGTIPQWKTLANSNVEIILDFAACDWEFVTQAGKNHHRLLNNGTNIGQARYVV